MNQLEWRLLAYFPKLHKIMNIHSSLFSIYAVGALLFPYPSGFKNYGGHHPKPLGLWVGHIIAKRLILRVPSCMICEGYWVLTKHADWFIRNFCTGKINSRNFTAVYVMCLRKIVRWNARNPFDVALLLNCYNTCGRNAWVESILCTQTHEL